MNEKNYGLNLELERQHQKPEDYQLGAVPFPCLAQIPPAERDKYLPKGEVQKGIEDMMDCASRAAVNILETKLTWLLQNHLLPKGLEQWFRRNGYVNAEERILLSDAFVAINSGTTRSGNSLIAPLEAIRKKGLIPKHLLPLQDWMTFDDYHNPNRITTAMRKLGEEFVARLTINYERVAASQYAELLETDFLDVGGFAWPLPVNGEYPKTDSRPNHAFVPYKKPPYFIFDNYLDSVDGDFVKKLAPDYYLLDSGYRIIVSIAKKNDGASTASQRLKSVWQWLEEIVKYFLSFPQRPL